MAYSVVPFSSPNLPPGLFAKSISSMQTLSASCLDLSDENGYLCRSQGLAMRRSEGDTPHEACAHSSGTVGGEGVEEVLAWPPSAGGAVFDPEHWTWKIRQTISEVLPDHLGGQIP